MSFLWFYFKFIEIVIKQLYFFKNSLIDQVIKMKTLEFRRLGNFTPLVCTTVSEHLIFLITNIYQSIKYSVLKILELGRFFKIGPIGLLSQKTILWSDYLDNYLRIKCKVFLR